MFSAASALFDFFHLPSAQAAVLLPLLLSAVFWYRARTRALPEGTVLLLVAGTCTSVVFSLVIRSDGHVSQYCLPGYLVIVGFCPARLRPSPGQVFALCFASSLIADVWGMVKYFNTQSSVSWDLFNGIGGDGFRDALFITPWLAMFLAGAFEYLSSRQIENKQTGEFLREAWASLVTHVRTRGGFQASSAPNRTAFAFLSLRANKKA